MHPPQRNKTEEQVEKPATLGKEQPVKELKMHQPHGQGKQEHQGMKEQPGWGFEGQTHQPRQENPQGGQIGQGERQPQTHQQSQELVVGTDNINWLMR